MAEKCSFKEGEFVVYPAHGVGVIKGIEVQHVGDVELKVVVISFDKDKMTVRLPLNQTTASRIRALSSKEDMLEAVECLKVHTRVKKTMWSRRAQEYESKINSGEPKSIAQVVRDLHRSANQPEHSYSERQIYQTALTRLAREYAVVENVDENSAMCELQRVLEVA